jgi:hypothetical protein
MRWSLWIVILVVASGLGIAVYYFLDDSGLFERVSEEPAGASEKIVNATNEAFPQNYSITVEDAEDFPGDPAQLHPPRFEALSTRGDKLGEYPAAGFLRGGQVGVTSHHIYYFDTEAMVIKEAVTGATLEISRVPDARLGGFFAIGAAETRLVWSRSTPSPEGNRAELVLGTRHNGEISERVLVSQTFESREAFLPLAWTEDSESLFYTVFDFEEGRVPSTDFSNLYQLHVEALLTDGDALTDDDIKPNSIAFPSEEARLIALDVPSGALLFQDGTELLLTNIAGGSESVFPIPESQVATSAAFSVGQMAVTLEKSDGASEVLFIDTVTDLQESFAIAGSAIRLIGFNDGFIFTREEPAGLRGTFRLSRRAEGGPLESKLSDRLSVFFK